MTGFAGGTTRDDVLDTMGERLRRGLDHEVERRDAEPYGLVSVGADPVDGTESPSSGAGWTGAVYGAPRTADGPLDPADVCRGVLERPESFLPTLDGSFAVVAVDPGRDRVVLATDRLASRPLYYATGDAVGGGLAFGSEVGAVCAAVDSPTVDERGVSDLLWLGHMWSDRTLVTEIRSLPAASVLEYVDGSVTVHRYWRPSYAEARPGSRYVRTMAARYRASVESMAETVEGPVGVWLSGGLDSRLLAAELARLRDAGVIEGLRTFTYDANPAGGGNPELARRVADAIDAPITTVELRPEVFVDVVDDAIDATGGVLSWQSAVNISAIRAVDDPPAVVLEGAGQGELMGHHLRRYHLNGAGNAVASMISSEANADRATVERLLAADVSEASFAELAAEYQPSQWPTAVKDAHFKHYYSKNQLANDQFARDTVDTRVAYLDGAFLDHAAQLPYRYRMGTVPFTDGAIPYGAAAAKLALVRELAPELARIPYERTSLPPALPYPVNVAGFLVSTSIARLRSQITYGGTSLVDQWYRENDAMRDWLDDHLDAARERPLFDGAAIDELRETHLAGDANNVAILARVATVAAWLGRHVDGRATTKSVARSPSR